MSAACARTRRVAAVAAIFTTAVHAQPQLSLGKVWAESVIGDPIKSAQTGRGLQSLPSTAYSFDAGVYRSVVSRILVRLPQIDDEKIVSIRESVVYRRADGSAMTSHVLFIPDPLGAGLEPYRGVSAIVVTRLRDDRPKDRDSILRRWEPVSEQQRLRMEADGTFHRRLDTPFGQALERIVTNRVSVEPFPYKTNIDRSSVVKTIGVSRFIVIESDSFLEFSQVFPCKQMAVSECKTAATQSSDKFLAGVQEFLTFPAEGK